MRQQACVLAADAVYCILYTVEGAHACSKPLLCILLLFQNQNSSFRQLLLVFALNLQVLPGWPGRV